MARRSIGFSGILLFYPSTTKETCSRATSWFMDDITLAENLYRSSGCKLHQRSSYPQLCAVNQDWTQLTSTLCCQPTLDTVTLHFVLSTKTGHSYPLLCAVNQDWTQLPSTLCCQPTLDTVTLHFVLSTKTGHSYPTLCAVNQDWTQLTSTLCCQPRLDTVNLHFVLSTKTGHSYHTFNYFIHPIISIRLLNHDNDRKIHFEPKRTSPIHNPGNGHVQVGLCRKYLPQSTFE